MVGIDPPISSCLHRTQTSFFWLIWSFFYNRVANLAPSRMKWQKWYFYRAKSPQCSYNVRHCSKQWPNDGVCCIEQREDALFMAVFTPSALFRHNRGVIFTIFVLKMCYFSLKLELKHPTALEQYSTYTIRNFIGNNLIPTMIFVGFTHFRLNWHVSAPITMSSAVCPPLICRDNQTKISSLMYSPPACHFPMRACCFMTKHTSTRSMAVAGGTLW